MITKIIITAVAMLFLILCLAEVRDIIRYGLFGYQRLFMDKHNLTEESYIKHLCVTAFFLFASLVIIYELWIG